MTKNVTGMNLWFVCLIHAGKARTSASVPEMSMIWVTVRPALTTLPSGASLIGCVTIEKETSTGTLEMYGGSTLDPNGEVCQAIVSLAVADSARDEEGKRRAVLHTFQVGNLTWSWGVSYLEKAFAKKAFEQGFTTNGIVENPWRELRYYRPEAGAA